MMEAVAGPTWLQALTEMWSVARAVDQGQVARAARAKRGVASVAAAVDVHKPYLRLQINGSSMSR